MKASRSDSHYVPGNQVPLLDVGGQNEPIRDQIVSAMARVYDSGCFVHGPDCQQLEAAIAGYCSVRQAIGCASGSDALLLALMAVGVGKGDEVILPSFTFFATAGVVWRLGARPVFVDIDPVTFNIDAGQIEQAVTAATRAIIPVHLFGQCADLTPITKIAARHSLTVIEDAAQAIGAEDHGRRAGSIGKVGCFSFYPSKNLGGFGDGGMLTTDDGPLSDRLRILRNHGQHPRYHHSAVGINSRLDTLQAAVLQIKLEHLEAWTQQRGKNAARYTELFTQAGLEQVVGLPQVGENQRMVWNQYTIRVADGKRDALADHLTHHQIGTAVYYPLPLHQQACFESLGYRDGSLPHTEKAASEVLSLPIYPGLSDAQQQWVVRCMTQYYAGISANAASAA